MNTKPPKIAELIIRLLVRSGNRQDLLGDLHEEYQNICSEQGVFRAKLWYIGQIFIPFFNFIRSHIMWNIVMFKNYLLIALRVIKKYKGISFINIFGLSAGMACCLFIFMYISYEMSYDRFIPDHNRIFRIALSSKGPASEDREPANTPLLANHLKEHFSQVEEVGRITQWSGAVVIRENESFRERGVRYSDPEILTLFSIPFIIGNPQTALIEPETVVLTKKTAEKYFGRVDVLDQTIRVQTLFDTKDYRITGVVEDPPKNTHFTYRMFLSFETIKNNRFIRGGHLVTITYAKLEPGVQAAEFENLIRPLTHELLKNDSEEENVTYTNTLQPIADIHLHSHLTWEMSTPGSTEYLTIFSVIALFILLIACVNFMNLSTARSTTRMSEVGMRKVVGAQSSQLMRQFLSESLLMSVLALAIAILIIICTLPFFNSLANTEFLFADLFSLPMIFVMSLLIVVTGILGGGYPAFLLSAFQPVKALKGRLQTGTTKGSLIQKALVVFQFSISIALVVSSMIVYQQLTFMKSQHLGFKKEQKLIVPIKRGDQIKNNFEMIKNDFLSYHKIMGATVTSSVPGRGMNVWWTWPTGEEDEKKRLVNCLFSDYDFFPEYGLKMIAGRKLLNEHYTDSTYSSIILNRAAVQAFQWNSPEEALNKYLWDDQIPVVGVFEDFHWQGLQNAIEPLAIMIWPIGFRYITLTVDTENLEETVAFINNVYREWFPDQPLESFFLDTEFEKQYQFEERIGKLLQSFAILGIVIACMGLFGMASYVIERKTKEIGIRKVLGASVLGIMVMLSKQFVRWILLANLIAWPLVYLAMNRWLQNFVYRVDMTIWPYLLAGVFTMAIALLTLSRQTIKSAFSNPVDSLRNE